MYIDYSSWEYYPCFGIHSAGCLPERLVLSLAALFDLSTLEKLEDAAVHKEKMDV